MPKSRILKGISYIPQSIDALRPHLLITLPVNFSVFMLILKEDVII